MTMSPIGWLPRDRHELWTLCS